MATGPWNELVLRLRRAALSPEGAGRTTDGELLTRFIERRDEAALASLVHRHGPMVWGVCRRLLGHHDAEDALQATFLVLVRKASTVAPREMVGNWLHGVARRTALQAARSAARRRAREARVALSSDAVAPAPAAWADVRPLLDEELGRLPEIYRAVIVLCELEGRTRTDVARQLNVPEGTVGGRLARARVLLARRLARRGVLLSGGTLTAILAHHPVTAGIPPLLFSNTIAIAGLHAAGRAPGAIPPTVTTLCEGVVNAMFMTKLKAALSVMLLLGVAAMGTALLTRQTASGQEEKKPAPAEPPAPAAARPENTRPEPAKTNILIRVRAGRAQARVTVGDTIHEAVADEIDYDDERGALFLKGNAELRTQKGKERPTLTRGEAILVYPKPEKPVEKDPAAHRG